MMGWSDGGWGVGEWVAMSLLMVIFWGAVLTAGSWLLRGNRSSPTITPAVGAAALLDERFARGEIDEDEFTRRREALRAPTAHSRQAWAEVDRSHRKLAHRGSYEGRFWASPSTVRPARNAPYRRIVLTQVTDGSFRLDRWQFDARRVSQRVRAGALEVWDIVNTTGVEHPFHLHTWPFQALRRGHVVEPFPAWRDVAVVQPGQTVRRAIPFTLNKGHSVYHCHVAMHEDAGMMGVVEVAQSLLAGHNPATYQEDSMVDSGPDV